MLALARVRNLDLTKGKKMRKMQTKALQRHYMRCNQNIVVKFVNSKRSLMIEYGR